MYGLIDAMKCSAHLTVAMWKSLVPFMTVVRLLLFAGRNNSGQPFSEHGSVGPHFRLFDGIARCCRRGVGGARLVFLGELNIHGTTPAVGRVSAFVCPLLFETFVHCF